MAILMKKSTLHSEKFLVGGEPEHPEGVTEPDWCEHPSLVQFPPRRSV